MRAMIDALVVAGVLLVASPVLGLIPVAYPPFFTVWMAPRERHIETVASHRRAWAWLNGREFVTPDDVKALAQATLAHRLSLRPEAELEGVGVAAVLDSAIGSVPVPR